MKPGTIFIKDWAAAHGTTHLGRKIDDTGVKTGDVCKQDIKPKSHAGERKSAIPEFVVEEIIVAKERYDYWKGITPGVLDDGYI